MAPEPEKPHVLVDIAKGIGLIKSPEQKRVEALQKSLQAPLLKTVTWRLGAGTAIFIFIICAAGGHASVGIFFGILGGIIIPIAYLPFTFLFARHRAKGQAEKGVAKQNVALQAADFAGAARKAAEQAAQVVTGARDAAVEASALASEATSGRLAARDAVTRAELAVQAAAKAALESTTHAATTEQAATVAKQCRSMEDATAALQAATASMQAACSAEADASRHAKSARDALEDVRQAVALERANFEYFLKRLNQVEIYLGFLNGADQNTRSNIQQSISKEITPLVTRLHTDASAVLLIQSNKTLQNLLRTMQAGINVYQLQITQASSLLEAAHLD